MKPLLSDEDIKAIRNANLSETVPIFEVRDRYEAARKQDQERIAELVRRLVDQANLCEFKDAIGHDLRSNAAYLDIAAILPAPPQQPRP